MFIVLESLEGTHSTLAICKWDVDTKVADQRMRRIFSTLCLLSIGPPHAFFLGIIGQNIPIRAKAESTLLMLMQWLVLLFSTHDHA